MDLLSPKKQTFMEKATQGVDGYKKAGKKAVKKSKEWGAATKQGLDDSTAAYKNQLAQNKAQAQSKELSDNIKSAFGAQGGGRRRRRRRRRTRRRRKRGGRKRSRRRRRTRRRKKRTKRRTRRRRVRGGSCPASVSESSSKAEKDNFNSVYCVNKRVQSKAATTKKRRKFAQMRDTNLGGEHRALARIERKRKERLLKEIAVTKAVLAEKEADRRRPWYQRKPRKYNPLRVPSVAGTARAGTGIRPPSRLRSPLAHLRFERAKEEREAKMMAQNRAVKLNI